MVGLMNLGGYASLVNLVYFVASEHSENMTHEHPPLMVLACSSSSFAVIDDRSASSLSSLKVIVSSSNSLKLIHDLAAPNSALMDAQALATALALNLVNQTAQLTSLALVAPFLRRILPAS